MLILNPLNVIWFAVGSVLPIRLSRARAESGDAAARRELRRAYLGSMPVVALYCLVAVVLAGPILMILYGDTYAAYGWVVAGAAVIRFVGYHSHLLAIGLRAWHRTRPIFDGLRRGRSLLDRGRGDPDERVRDRRRARGDVRLHLIWTAVWARAYVGAQGEPSGSWEEEPAGVAALDDVPGQGASGGRLS